jgi:hypothetical protein
MLSLVLPAGVLVWVGRKLAPPAERVLVAWVEDDAWFPVPLPHGLRNVQAWRRKIPFRRHIVVGGDFAAHELPQYLAKLRQSAEVTTRGEPAHHEAVSEVLASASPVPRGVTRPHREDVAGTARLSGGKDAIVDVGYFAVARRGSSPTATLLIVINRE